MTSCMICTTQGFPLVSYGTIGNWKTISKLVASIAILITKLVLLCYISYFTYCCDREDYCEFLSGDILYCVRPISTDNHVCYCVVLSKDFQSKAEFKFVRYYLFVYPLSEYIYLEGLLSCKYSKDIL